MKKVVCVVLCVIVVLYGGCFFQKNGTDVLPTIEEFYNYTVEKKDIVVETYRSLKSRLNAEANY